MCLSSFHGRGIFLFGKRTKVVIYFKKDYWNFHPMFSKILLLLIIIACCKSESSLGSTLYTGLLLYPHCLFLSRRGLGWLKEVKQHHTLWNMGKHSPNTSLWQENDDFACLCDRVKKKFFFFRSTMEPVLSAIEHYRH